MVGNHSGGEASSHKLSAIGDAYRNSVAASSKEDPLLDGRRQAILNQLNSVDQRLREVNRNSSEIEDQIYRALQEVMAALKEETQRKVRKWSV